MLDMADKFFGKYRGRVTNNIDPMQLGRVQISVPSVLGPGQLSWAMPCVPYAGKRVGFFAIPPIDANIWVEFEGGDLNYPIWTGCFWGLGEVPATPAIAETKVFKTETMELKFNDLPGIGGISLKANSPAVLQPLKLELNAQGITLDGKPASITMGQSGIEIKQGAQSIQLTPANVSINKGALEVV